MSRPFPQNAIRSNVFIRRFGTKAFVVENRSSSTDIIGIPKINSLVSESAMDQVSGWLKKIETVTYE